MPTTEPEPKKRGEINESRARMINEVEIYFRRAMDELFAGLDDAAVHQIEHAISTIYRDDDTALTAAKEAS